MMKRIIIILLILPLLTSCNNLNMLFKELKKEPHAEYVSLSFPLIHLMKLFLNDENGKIIKKIKSIKVLEMEKCTDNSLELLKKKTSKLKGYEMLLTVNEEGENIVKVLAKLKKEKIKELVVVVADDAKKECSLIQIKANLSMEDINKFINDDMKKQTGKKKKHNDSKRV